MVVVLRVLEKDRRQRDLVSDFLLAVFTIYSCGEEEGAGPPPVAYSHFFLLSTLQCTSLGLGAGVAGPVKQVGRNCYEIRPVDTPSSVAEERNKVVPFNSLQVYYFLFKVNKVK